MKRFKNKRILIVDDEEIILNTLREQFEIHGSKVFTATNGIEAFDMIKDHEYDLVISDVRMPKCSGTELLEMIRNYDKKAPPIVLISAFQDISIDRAKELGAKGLFLKPNFMQNILDHLENVL